MPSKGEEKYLYDDKALEKYRKTHKGPFTLQRYKGLGEMDAEQLWETTLDPERRLLKLVEIEDARMASEMTELLMGTDVPPRKAFIYDHATDAALDIYTAFSHHGTAAVHLGTEGRDFGLQKTERPEVPG